MTQVIIGFLFILIIITAGWLIAFYNMMINKKTQVDSCWEDISIHLMRKADLVPKLVDKVQKDLVETPEVLIQIMEVKSELLSARNFDQMLESSNEINKYLDTIFAAVSAQQPMLKARGDYVLLERKFREINKKLAESIEQYNHARGIYQNFLDTFPNNIAALIIGANQSSYSTIKF